MSEPAPPRALWIDDRLHFAEFFRALGGAGARRAADLRDRFRYSAAGGSEVSLTREQTIMQGASSCSVPLQVARDHEYR